MNQRTIICIFFIILFPFVSIISQEQTNEKIIFLSNFQAFQSEKNSNVESLILESLKKKFESNKFKVLPTNGSNLTKNLE